MADRTDNLEARTNRHLALAEELAAGVAGPRPEAALDQFGHERASLYQTLDALLERGDAARATRMIRALRDCWWRSGRLAEGRARAERLVALPRTPDDHAGRAAALDLAGALAVGQDDLAGARRHFEQSLALRRVAGSPVHIAQALHHLAAVVRWGPDGPAAARPLLEECLARAQAADNAFLAEAAVSSLGPVLLDLGEHARARDFMTRAATTNARHGRDTALPFALDNFAALAAALGQAEPALRLAGAGERHRERLGTFRLDRIRLWVDRYLDAARAGLTPEAATLAWLEGQAMTAEQALACALTGKPGAAGG